MKRDTVNMLIRVGGGVLVGYLLGRYLVPAARGIDVSAPPAQAPSRDIPLHRITGDFLSTCRDLRPLLNQLHVDTADGELDVGDAARAIMQFNQTMTGSLQAQPGRTFGTMLGSLRAMPGRRFASMNGFIPLFG